LNACFCFSGGLLRELLVAHNKAHLLLFDGQGVTGPWSISSGRETNNKPSKNAGAASSRSSLRLTYQVRQLGDVRRNPSRLLSPTMMDKGRMGTIIIWHAYRDDMVRS